MATMTAVLSLIALQASGATYVPSETRVLVLPPLNLSGDKYEEMKRNQVDEARKTLRDRFEKRGFDLVANADAEVLVRASGVDLRAEENQTRENLFRLADDAKARLVVLVVIERTSQKTVPQLFGQRLEGFATLKTWLLDARERTAIFSGKRTEGKSSRNAPTGSLRQIRAVRLGLDEQFKEFFKPYTVRG